MCDESVSLSVCVSRAFPLAFFSFSYLFVLSYSNLLAFALSYFYLIIIPWMNFCFLTSDRKGVTPDGRRGRKDMGDSSQNICMKKKYFQ